jgi:isocitrate/isopropylmalate dehydrogenase
VTRTVLVIPGDGIGPEVTAPAVEALRATGAPLEFVHGEAGRHVTQRIGAPVDPDTLARLADADAILFGATTTVPGAPSAVLALRRALGLFATVRPCRTLAGLGDPRCDVTVVRELTEDLYVQREREVPGGAEAVSLVTEAASRRVARFAWDLAARTRPIRLSVAHKATILPRTQGLFLRVAMEEAQARGLAPTGRLADSLAHDLVRDPSGPHLILAPNVFGDLLSDVASAMSGGLGVAPSSSHGDGAPLFEPVHGSAPDIAGKGVANPTAAMLSAAMLLDELGEAARATRLRRAIEEALTDPAARTPDLGGRAGTQAFTARVLKALAP